MNTRQTTNKACKCSKTNCIQSYCNCYQKGIYCSTECNCYNCCNQLTKLRGFYSFSIKINKKKLIFKEKIPKNTGNTYNNALRINVKNMTLKKEGNHFFVMK